MRWLVLLVLLAPFATADHVYSHRFVVEGRLVGGNGLPLAGVAVHVDAQGESFADACAEAQRSVTDENGDFWFCYHKHAIEKGAVVSVWAANSSGQGFVDTQLRKMSFLLVDQGATGVAPPNWSESFRVSGRVWSRGPSELDGVAVEGIALRNEHVTVALGLGGSWSNYPRTTDGYGDFDAVLRVVDAGGIARLDVDVTARGGTVHSAVESKFHRVFVDVRLPVEEVVRVASPGSSSPPVSPALPLVVGAACVAMVLYQRKKG